jgi:hypothetical protein
MPQPVDELGSTPRDARRLTRRQRRTRLVAVVGVVVIAIAATIGWLAMRGSGTPDEASLPEPTVTQEPLEPAESAPPVVGVLTADEPWVPGWTVVSGEERATVSPSLVCGATHDIGPLSGPTQTLTNGSALVRVHAVTDARYPTNATKRIYVNCRATSPNHGPPIWFANDADGKRVRSSYAVWPANESPRVILLVTVVQEGSKGGGGVDLAEVVTELWYAVDGSPRPPRHPRPATS